MRITAKKLRAAKACKGHIEKFEEQWPGGCNVTRKNCEIAFKKLRMNVSWAGHKLLSREASIELDKMCAERHKVCIEAAAVNTSRCKCYEDDIEAFYQAAKR